MSGSRANQWRALKAKIAGLEGLATANGDVRVFGDADLDGVFPAGGLPLGRWHEVVGNGLEIETAAAAAAFVAALAQPLATRGAVVWVMRREDLHAPGLATLGFPAQRLIQVGVSSEAEGFAALEDALATAGVAAAIGESQGVDLTVGRRLQLACERRGATGFVLRRRPYGGGTARADVQARGGSAAATRWRVAPAPSDPGEEPGLGAPCWRVILERCRGGRPGEWLMEKTNDAQALRVVAAMGDRQFSTPPSQTAWRHAV